LRRTDRENHILHLSAAFAQQAAREMRHDHPS
jgi:hypothetical protein